MDGIHVESAGTSGPPRSTLEERGSSSSSPSVLMSPAWMPSPKGVRYAAWSVLGQKRRTYRVMCTGPPATAAAAAAAAAAVVAVVGVAAFVAAIELEKGQDPWLRIEQRVEPEATGMTLL